MADAQARIVISARDDTAGALAKAKAGFAGLQRESTAIASSFIALGSSIAGVFAAAGISSFARNIVSGLDALNDLRDATGASIENISALEDIAARTGTSFETVGAALTKFNKVLNEAKPGSGVDDVLKSIGLSAAELKKLDPAEGLQRAAIALNKFADDGDKARAAEVLFGRSLREVAPFLKDVAEKGTLNATVLTKQAEEAERFNKNLFELQKNTTDLARNLAGPLVSAINETIDKFRQGAKEGKGFFETLRNEQLKLLGFSGGDDFVDRVQKINGLTEALKNQLLPLDLRNKFEADLNRLLKEQASARAALLTSTAGAGRGSVNPDLVKPSLVVTDSVKKSKDVVQDYIDKLIEAQIETLDFSFEQRAAYDIAIGKLGKVNDLTKQQILLTARGADLLKNQKPFGPDIPLAELERRNDAAKDVANQIAQTTQGQINALTKQYGNLDDALQRGEITSRQYVDALDLLDQKFADLTKPVEAASKEISKFAEQAARNIQDAVGQTVLDTLEGNFDDILSLWGKLLERMVAEAIAAQLNEALFGGLFGGKGQGSGLIGDAVKMFGGFFADGGYLQPGKIGVVGEAGPELIMAGARGATITPNGGGGTVNVTYNIQQVGSGVSRGEVIAGLSAVRDSTRAEFSQILSRKGLA